MRLLKQLVPVALVAFAGGAIVGAVQGNPLLTLLLGVATAVLAVFVYARVVVRWSERRAPVEAATQGLLHGVASGPALLTGGGFGPEGNLYAVVFGLLLTVVFMWLARRRGNVVPFRRGATATLPQ
ncbi:hypothetical protein ACWEU6_33610 [Streptosporangium sandarakinum]|uniref:hypothetical protein n=1 Tax=Streptosporangium sandarakinum TaxID=1260955 RepID=UPI00368DDC2A